MIAPQDLCQNPGLTYAATGGVFGDVSEPQPVRAGRGEVTTHEIVMHRRAGLLGPAALLPEHAPPVVVPADPPRGPVRHGGPGAAGLIGQEAVAELRVLTVGVEQRVRAIRLVP
ncbi:hypothetical protein ACFZBM_36630 [Streptomyces lavendulae]|uniref:hypothetical protein n=1 Tax=Streptomyces lavendulae TaxID=1914 RepID=UPI00131D2C02|nr:hypothetical protein [Streptomyces lavendulae]